VPSLTWARSLQLVNKFRISNGVESFEYVEEHGLVWMELQVPNEFN
jgi:hypothetical protein